ncbi:MAG: hypothetical protein HC897_19875, partial [Thermoanaerobaculia bacterium]|nr:hypothetical protein [Thermoanaerobaculia bacterium]
LGRRRNGHRARWRARLDRREIGLDDLVLILAHTRAGVEGVIALGTLRPFLGPEPRPADLKSSPTG